LFKDRKKRMAVEGGYRKDIDGLRALAILPVVAFHLNLSVVPGGFVGVDIFFVISGFLITQLLYSDMQADQFSLLRFYERRVRRIGPVLIATILVVFALGLRYCVPDEMVSLSKSMTAATLFASNFYFWNTEGYFDLAAASKPLLHTWSLAVEEQFYIVWPLVLAICMAYLRRRLITIVAVLALASLAVSAIGVYRFPTAAFYLPFGRLWELALGGMIALGAFPEVNDQRARNVLGAVGLILILGSVLLIRGSMPFPGLLAIPPCLGAALIIIAGRGGGSAVGTLLALPPVAFLGAISYSLYMWHWPIAVFQNNYAILADGLNSKANKILILGVSLVVAALSYWLIEQPFRRAGRFRPQPRTLMRLAGVGGAACVAVSITASATNGLPSRFSRNELQMYEHLRVIIDDDWRTNVCFLWNHRVEWRLADECTAMDQGKRNYLLMGDSHAAELWAGLGEAFTQVNFLQVTAADCMPTIRHSAGESPDCVGIMDDTLQRFVAHTPVKRVILAARWKESALPSLADTLDWLTQHGVTVTLVGPTAVYDSPVPRLVVAAMRAKDPLLLLRHLDRSIDELDTKMASLAAAHHTSYISVLSLECTRPACAADGWPEINDPEHFNAAGSRLIGRRIRERYPTFAPSSVARSPQEQ
jgi:peptidoglycan/LPS O-acetylase OafA/YrhL